MPYKNPADQAASQRRHYLANKDDYRARSRAAGVKRADQIRNYVLQYLTQHPCVDCGEADVLVLEFDHRDREQKCFAIGEAASGKCYSFKKLVAEIEKCDVRCANCHRRRTAKQLGWFRALIDQPTTTGAH